MAEKRMIAKSIVDSDDFLTLPLSSQALYLHLNFRADDDGFVNNPKRITAYIGASEDDLRLLLMKRFIIGFESGVIVIKHWRMHNTLQRDRYKPTDYQEEFSQLGIKQNKAYTLLADSGAKQIGSGMETDCFQNGSRMETQSSIEKNSIDKNRVVKSENDKSETLSALPESMRLVVQDWLNYKKEKRQPYKPTGLKSLISTINNKVSQYGERAVSEVIHYSMSCNYQGIVWAKLDDKPRQNVLPVKVLTASDIELDETQRLIAMTQRLRGG